MPVVHTVERFKVVVPYGQRAGGGLTPAALAALFAAPLPAPAVPPLAALDAAGVPVTDSAGQPVLGGV